MRNNKHPHVRYNILNYYFRNKPFTFNDLLEFVNHKIAKLYSGESFETRILRNDLKNLEIKKMNLEDLFQKTLEP
jgi:hypothetical protein